MEQISHCVQYGVWPNCCNACDFCLREERIPYTKEKQLRWLDYIKQNIKTIDWKNKFNGGISLLGGELYFITDEELQESFLELIDVIIEYVLKPNGRNCKYSTVTNGIYDPTFLYKVVDKIKDSVGIERVDVNFSYDLKYRFKNEDTRKLVLHNINEFHKRYNYKVGVQMILTQYLIDMWREGKFDVKEFTDTQIPGNILTLLYPHPTKAGKVLTDFYFKRNDLLDFVIYLKKNCYETYYSFLLSTKNSCSYKYTGLRDRVDFKQDLSEEPTLSDGKEIINEKCGHSILYKCYSDCDECLLCDLKELDEEAYL